MLLLKTICCKQPAFIKSQLDSIHKQSQFAELKAVEEDKSGKVLHRKAILLYRMALVLEAAC